MNSFKVVFNFGWDLVSKGAQGAAGFFASKILVNIVL